MTQIITGDLMTAISNHNLIAWMQRAMGAELENEKLRAAIATHHAQKADDRCIEDDDRLYAAARLPPCDRHVGDKAAMLANCARFIERRCEAGKWPSYAELEQEIERLKAELSKWTSDPQYQYAGSGPINRKSIEYRNGQIDDLLAQIRAIANAAGFPHKDGVGAKSERLIALVESQKAERFKLVVRLESILSDYKP